MKRAIVVFAAAWFLALGTRAAEHAHNAAHAREDAESARAMRPDGPSPPPPPAHDESNCHVHALLNAPLIAPPAVVLPVCPGAFVTFVTELAASPVTLRIPSRTDCRGPPLAC